MKLKKYMGDYLKKMPVVSDYYLYYWLFPRCANSFRGVYSSFAEALSSIPKNIEKEYYIDEKSLEALDVEAEIIRLEKINPDDFTLLPYLQKAFAESQTLFELGGNTGNAYFSYQKHIEYPPEIRWIICDLPVAVNVGRHLFSKIEDPRICFTTSLEKMNQVDILLTSGTLQYIEPSLPKLLGQLVAKPRNVIVNRVPLYEGEEYVTLQSFIDSYVPYKVENIENFLQNMFNLGYELIDTWTKKRTMNIPFHPECFVDSYKGFYFRQTTP